MAEKKKGPMSLNQLHNRFLDDISASQSNSCRPSLIPPADVVKGESKHKPSFRATPDAPCFNITDFDSPSPTLSSAEMPLLVNNEDRRLSGEHVIDGEDNMTSLNKCIPPSGDDILSQPEKNKPLKVKIKGRRRLCKLSNDDPDTEEQSNAFSGFESPSPPNNVSKSNYNGGNEIRDILSDLSSRLGSLSIQKTRSESVFKEGTNHQKIGESLEYANAPSFSLEANQSNSLLKATNELYAEHSQNITETGYTKTNDNKHVIDLKLKDQETAVDKVVSIEPSFVYPHSEEDSDDCVITGSQKFTNKAENQYGKSRLPSDDCDEVQILDDNTDELTSGKESSFTLSGPNSTYTLPAKIATMLYPHQREGLKWLWSLHCKGKGGILGDDMGLGKTMQICGFLAGLFHSRLIKRVLVVAPKTLLPHWLKELGVVGLSEKTREYFGVSLKAREYELQYILQDKGVLLTTYDIVRNNSKALCGESYFHDEINADEATWDYMILDEGHLIKNPSTQRAKSLLEIPCAHRIIISGTPLQNNLKELWALFNFCCPELLGDKKCFKMKYESAILRGNEKNASDRDKRIGSTVAQDLRACIQPYFLRRMKSEVFSQDDAKETAKLSKKNEVIVWLRLSNCQRQLYEAFLKSELVLSAFDGSPLAALTILKKICDHPLLLTKRAAEDVLEGMETFLDQKDNAVAEKLAMHIADVTERHDFVENHDNISCKISFILSLLDNLIPEGHSVLIFSQTRKMLNLIQDSLQTRGYDFLRIDGTTKAEDRLKIVNDFQSGNGAPIFLLTSQVGGLGLTLTKADRVIVVDPAWNPSTDNQSVDRAYRIGQKKDVIVYRLMTCGSVEEKIYRKQVYKGGLFKSATEQKEQIRYFSQQELKELFSLPKQGFDISVTQQLLHEEHDREHKMDSYLNSHIKFLESLHIAGISHHSLLFSKTAPVPVVEEEELASFKQSRYVGNSSSQSSREPDGDSARYAFNPKDVDLRRKTFCQNDANKPTESEIKDKIKRLSHILGNKVMVSNLPDKGEKLRKQIAELNLELDRMRIKKTEREVVDLDDIVGGFNRVLNV